MTGRRQMALGIYRERLRGLTQQEKNLYMHLRLSDGAICGFFRIGIRDVEYDLELSESEVRAAFAGLEAHGSSIFEDGYVFLPRYSEDITAITATGRWSRWPEHLKAVISAYIGRPDNRAWRAFLTRFREMIEEAMPGHWLLLQIPSSAPAEPHIATGLPPAVATTPPAAPPDAQTSEPDDITKLLDQLASGVPDETLPGGIIKAKTTGYDRRWIVQLYNGYGYEIVSKAIDAVLAKGWKGRVSQERVQAAIEGTLDTFFDQANARQASAAGAPSTSDRYIDFGEGMKIARY